MLQNRASVLCNIKTSFIYTNKRGRKKWPVFFHKAKIFPFHLYNDDGVWFLHVQILKKSKKFSPSTYIVVGTLKNETKFFKE